MSTVNANSTTSAAPTDGELRADAASLARFGEADAAIAQATLSMDEQQRNARAHREEARELAREQAFERIDHLRRAAQRQMVAGVTQGSLQVGAGGCQVAAAFAKGKAAKALEGAATMLDGSGRIAGSVLERQAKDHELVGEHHGVISQQHRDRADSAEEHRSAIQASRERAASRLDAVAGARARARLAGLRG